MTLALRLRRAEGVDGALDVTFTRLALVQPWVALAFIRIVATTALTHTVHTQRTVSEVCALFGLIARLGLIYSLQTLAPVLVEVVLADTLSALAHSVVRALFGCVARFADAMHFHAFTIVSIVTTTTGANRSVDACDACCIFSTLPSVIARATFRDIEQTFALFHVISFYALANTSAPRAFCVESALLVHGAVTTGVQLLHALAAVLIEPAVALTRTVG